MISPRLLIPLFVVALLMFVFSLHDSGTSATKGVVLTVNTAVATTVPVPTFAMPTVVIPTVSRVPTEAAANPAPPEHPATAVALPTPEPPRPNIVATIAAPDPQLATIVVTSLENIAQNGFDSDARVNNGLGGLFRNWKYGSTPMGADFNAVQPNCQVVKTVTQCTRTPTHDAPTDLRYLHDLWMYTSQHPGDARFQAEIQRYTNIVKTEFANPSEDDPSWSYDEWRDLARLSGDGWYRSRAEAQADFWYQTFNQSGLGVLYPAKYSSDGYRVAETLQAASALVTEGTLDGNATWTRAGQDTISFVYAHAYNMTYHAFPVAMGTLRTTTGATNACETFLDGPEGGNVLRADTNAGIASAFLNVYLATRDRSFLARSVDLLDGLQPMGNVVHLWDWLHYGFDAQETWNGTGYCDPGLLGNIDPNKHSARVLGPLRAFHVASTLTGNRYADAENLLRRAATEHAYSATAHGYLRAQDAGWGTLSGQSSQVVDSATTTNVLEALLTFTEPTPR